jgi:hypothetical protein
MQVVEPEPLIGQQFIIRPYLAQVLARAHFEGDAWNACVAAFLSHPGLPLLMHNGTSKAPASFFLRLYTSREPTYALDGEGQWGEAELRRELADLGEQTVVMLLAPATTETWVAYFNEGLDTVLAFHGRSKPGRRYTPEEDEEDLSSGTLIRSLVPRLTRATIVRLDLRDLGNARVELSDGSGHRYQITFARIRCLRHPSAGNEEVVTRVDEIRGPSGRRWFVFPVADQHGGRILAVQAESATWTETT